jgi:putative ABC transport system permease protein
LSGSPGGMTNSVRLVLRRNDVPSADRVKTLLEANLAAAGVSAVSSHSQSESRFAFDQHMLMIYVLLVTMSMVVAVVGGLGLMTTMSLNVLERRREMGVLRAIGATPGTVGMIIVTEAAVVGLMSWTLAALAAWPLSKAVGNLLLRTLFRSGLDFSFDLSGPVIWLVVSLVAGTLAGLVPAWQAARAPVREALGYE